MKDRDLIEQASVSFVQLHRWQIEEIERAIKEADAGLFATEEEMEWLFVPRLFREAVQVDPGSIAPCRVARACAYRPGGLLYGHAWPLGGSSFSLAYPSNSAMLKMLNDN